MSFALHCSTKTSKTRRKTNATVRRRRRVGQKVRRLPRMSSRSLFRKRGVAGGRPIREARVAEFLGFDSTLRHGSAAARLLRTRDASLLLRAGAHCMLEDRLLGARDAVKVITVCCTIRQSQKTVRKRSTKNARDARERDLDR